MIIRSRCKECKNITHVQGRAKPTVLHGVAIAILTAILTSVIIVTKLRNN